MLLLFNHRKFFLKRKLSLLALLKLKANNFTHYFLPSRFNMNRMKIFNLVYKIKQDKKAKSDVVDRL